MTLPVSGQFDNASDSSNEDNKKNIPITYMKQNTYQNKIDANDEDGEIQNDNYYDEYYADEDFDNGKSINVQNFEANVDLSFKKKAKIKNSDKSDRATYDRVLDNRSKKIMYKMNRQKLFETVNGCISAGKEANVYHAPSCTGEDLVLKVYMTSIMKFKKRNEYIKGDNRFENASLNSSTKISKTWAEKEFRNLHRLHDTEGAIPCPRPIKQNGMVVLMSMIGNDGYGAPILKDVNDCDEAEWSNMYAQVVAYVRIMYQECHLVHGDLSEYNLLYHDKKVYVIDVSQSVEHEHPASFNFLRNDCKNINTFFRHKNIPTLSITEFFFFVILSKFGKHSDPDFYSKIDEMIASSTFSTIGEDEDYFMKCHIDGHLSDVNGEKIHEQYKAILKNPEVVNELPFLKVAEIDENMRNIRANKIKSIKHHKRTLRNKKEMLKKQLEGDESNDEVDVEDAVEGENTSERSKNDSVECKNKKDCSLSYRPKHEDLESKKARKKQVKEAQKEMRVQNKLNLLDEKFRTVSGFKYKNKLV